MKMESEADTDSAEITHPIYINAASVHVQDGSHKNSILELDQEDEADFKEWVQVASKIKIMVTGCTGVGKSTLLNVL